MSVQKTVQTVTIGSQSFVVPTGTKLADLLCLVGLQAIRSTYHGSPWKTFEYIDSAGVQISFGSQLVYEGESAAEMAKKQYIREQEALKDAERQAEPAND